MNTLFDKFSSGESVLRKNGERMAYYREMKQAMNLPFPFSKAKTSMVINARIVCRESDNKWNKTMADRLRENILVIRILEDVWKNRRVPQLWHSGDIYSFLISMALRWKPGTILNALSSEQARRRDYSRFRVVPDRGLADMLRYSVLDDLLNSSYQSSLNLMLDISFILGLVACWELTPQWILQVDPGAFLCAGKVKLIEETIVERVCELQNSGFVCMCTEDSIHTQIESRFTENEAFNPLSDTIGTNNRKKALAMVVVVILTGMLVNGLETGHLVSV